MTKLLLICVVVAALVTGCDAVEGQGSVESASGASVCPAGLVVQADVCPGTGGQLALCKAKGEENGVSAPVGVSWCLVATAPAEGVIDYVECVPVCP
ncbi:MAG TPA: hypothetical protein VFI42_15950 [Thermomicrobiaceae bacterium]|nr:hypothetical protein [Thermomicrobiaceae bacterium]